MNTKENNKMTIVVLVDRGGIEVSQPYEYVDLCHHGVPYKVLKERFYHPDVNIVIFKYVGVTAEKMMLPLDNAVMNALQSHGYSVLGLRSRYDAKD